MLCVRDEKETTKHDVKSIDRRPWKRASAILDYATLNYAACHGLHGNFHPCDSLLSSER